MEEGQCQCQKDKQWKPTQKGGSPPSFNSFRNVFSKHRGEKGPEIENETASKRNTFNENLKGPSICSGWGIPSYSVAEF